MKFRSIIILLLSAVFTFTIQSQVKATVKWEQIGPDGGDQFDIKISPTDPNTLFALSASNLHRSINAGENWEMVFSEEISWRGITSLAFDPFDSNHIFISNGELGIWESTDLGDSWTNCSAGLPNLGSYQGLYHPAVSLVFDINGRLYASMGEREIEDLPPFWIYRKDDSSTDWIPDDDGIQITASGLTQRISILLSVDGNDQLWAMIYGAGVYLYANGEWVLKNGDLPPEALKATFFLPDSSDSDHFILGTERNWIYETTNGGQSWSTMTLPEELAGLGILPLVYTIAMDPNNSQVVYTVARDYSDSTELPLFQPGPEQILGKGVYVSFNGGLEWTKTSVEFFFRAATDPSETITGEIPPYGDVMRSRIWYITTGGINSLLKSEDGGQTYRNITSGVHGLWINKILSYSVPGETDSRLFAAAEAGIYLYVNDASPWAEQGPVKDYLYTWSFAQDYSDSNYIFYGTGNPAWSFTDQRGVYRINYEDCFGVGCPSGGQLLENVGVWSVITTPAQHNKIYVATQEKGIMLSADYGENWESFNEGITLPESITDILLDQYGEPMLASSRTNNGDLFAEPPQTYFQSKDEKGAVYSYDHETLQWLPFRVKTDADEDPAIYDLELDPHDMLTVYAATAQGIYKSIDHENWEVVLENETIVDLLIDPLKPDYFYAVTSTDLLRSTDGGKQWNKFSNGLLRDIVFTLDIDETTGILYTGTAGQSVYRLLPDPNPLPLLTVTPERLDFGIHPIGFHHDLNITLKNDGEASLTVSNVALTSPSFTLPDIATPIILTPGNTTTITLRYTPQSTGIVNSYLTIESNSSLLPSYDFAISGEGRVADEPIPDVKVNGSDESISVPHGDLITVTLDLSAGDYVGRDTEQWIEFTLPDSQTIPILLACLPISDFTAPISFNLPNMPSGNYEISFAVDDGCNGELDSTWHDSVTFTVIQAPPELGVFYPPSQDFPDFGDVPIGSSKESSTVIYNSGESDLIIGSIDFSSSNFALSSPLSFPITISQGAYKEISVSFTPSSTGLQTATMNIYSNDPDSPEYGINLSGSGRGVVFPVPDVKVNGSDVSITVPNGDSVNIDLYLSAGDYAGRDTEYWIEFTLPGPQTIPVLLACLPISDLTEPISFTIPNLPSGNYEISFAVDDGCNGVLDRTWHDSVNFTVMQAPPELGVFYPPSQDFPDFGDVPIGSSKESSTVIYNSGKSDLIIDSIDFSSSDFALSSPLSFPITISQGAYKETSITFTPSSTGLQTATMNIYSNDPDSPEYGINLSGSGRGVVFPVPDVKVDGSDVSITVPNGDSVNIDLYLSAGDYAGQETDYWIRLTAPDSTTYWLGQSLVFVSSVTPVPFACLPIADYTAPISFVLPNMPPGNYEIYFAVDDGGCDNVLDGTWKDLLEFTITP